MIKSDLHVHTSYCDGTNTPEQLVLKAISLNLDEIGLVCHAYTPFDKNYCIKRENVLGFINEVNALKEKYKDKISVLCGTEYDYFSDMSVDGFDFVIGSVHYVYKDGHYIPVDESKDGLIADVETYYKGDFYAFCQDYYKLLGDVYSKVTPKFIAHFDLVSKFNALGDLFDETDMRYVKAWKVALDNLLSKGATFEINVGAIIRGFKQGPYPNQSQIDYVVNNGGKLILNSDAHSVDGIAFEFEKFYDLIK